MKLERWMEATGLSRTADKKPDKEDGKVFSAVFAKKVDDGYKSFIRRQTIRVLPVKAVLELED